MGDEVEKIEDAIAEQKSIIGDMIAKQESGVKSIIDTQSKTNEKIAKADEAIKRLEEEKKGLEERLSNMEVKANRPDFGAAPREYKATPGMQFVNSQEYKDAQGAKRMRTEAFEVGDIFNLKTLVGDGNDRAPVYSERVPELFYDPGQRPMTLRQLMNVGQTQSNAVDYFLETTFDEDGAGSQDGEGGTKAAMGMAFSKKTAPVETIAAHLPVSRQVLDDQAMLQSHIDSRLTYAVERELERQIIFGDGNNGELTGIWNTDGVATIGAPDGTDSILDHIRKSIRDVRLAEYGATGLILNPSDWADIELLKDDKSRYIWVSVTEGGQMRVWRVPVIETTVMDEGRFLVGAFGLGAQLWDRMASTIRISDSHESNFIKNVIVVLAEVRAALTVYRPKAFVRGTLNDISPT
jgi:HK97 family phage major capsid protein